MGSTGARRWLWVSKSATATVMHLVGFSLPTESPGSPHRDRVETARPDRTVHDPRGVGTECGVPTSAGHRRAADES